MLKRVTELYADDVLYGINLITANSFGYSRDSVTACDLFTVIPPGQLPAVLVIQVDQISLQNLQLP